MKDGDLRFYFYDQKEKQLFLDYESRKISKKEVSVVKFSPDHTKLICAAGKYLYLFDFKKIQTNNKTTPKRFGDSESFITAVDWSSDGKALRTVDCKYEYFFYDVMTFKEEPDGFVKYRDNEWDTQTCTLGWGVQGIWQPEQSGDFINTVAF
jgi:WD40 repeat protein